MINKFINKNYLIYGASIIISRGLEFLILFFAAYTMTKHEYGEFEYYKKLIETFSIGLAFGFPSLIMSYTRSNRNKDYFYILSVSVVLLIGIFSFILSNFFNYQALLIPIIFYALFFTGSITQNYIIVKSGSELASYYKIIVSLFFYAAVFCCIYLFGIKEQSFIYASYFILPVFIVYFLYTLKKINLEARILNKYFKLFKKLIYGSITMVISDFANILFLYTDIFIIKLLSQDPNLELANFSFALNIAAIMLIIPTTILQVNIENLKHSPLLTTQKLDHQISIIIIGISLLLIIFYKALTTLIYVDYQDTFLIFVLIIFAKIFQSLSNLFGTNLLIQKRYNLNLYINILSLIINVLLCYFFYKNWGLYGIISSSIISLGGRYFILRYLNYKYFKKHHVKV